MVLSALVEGNFRASGVTDTGIGIAPDHLEASRAPGADEP